MNQHDKQNSNTGKKEPETDTVRTGNVSVLEYPKKALQAQYECCAAPDNPLAVRAYKELVSKLADLLNHE